MVYTIKSVKLLITLLDALHKEGCSFINNYSDDSVEGPECIGFLGSKSNLIKFIFKIEDELQKKKVYDPEFIKAWNQCHEVGKYAGTNILYLPNVTLSRELHKFYNQVLL